MIVNDKKLEITSVEIFNLFTTGMFCGESVPKGCLGLSVLNFRPDKRVPFTKTGNAFWKCVNGLVSCYGWAPGTTEGFGGSKIILPVSVKSNVFSRRLGIQYMQFKGSLWSSHEANKIASKEIGQQLHSIGVKRAGDNGCYTSYLATDELLQRISRVVILGKPEQSPLI